MPATVVPAVSCSCTVQPGCREQGRRRPRIDRGARRRDERRLVTEPCDVAIVGYGPVGQTLAILLGQRGRSVVVLEKQPAAYPLPRAVHFDDEVARIL